MSTQLVFGPALEFYLTHGADFDRLGYADLTSEIPAATRDQLQKIEAWANCDATRFLQTVFERAVSVLHDSSDKRVAIRMIENGASRRCTISRKWDNYQKFTTARRGTLKAVAYLGVCFDRVAGTGEYVVPYISGAGSGRRERMRHFRTAVEEGGQIDLGAVLRVFKSWDPATDLPLAAIRVDGKVEAEDSARACLSAFEAIRDHLPSLGYLRVRGGEPGKRSET